MEMIPNSYYPTDTRMMKIGVNSAYVSPMIYCSVTNARHAEMS